MEKSSIALHQINQDLSNADFKQGLDTEFTNLSEKERQVKAEQQQARDWERRVKAAKWRYEWEYTKAENLRIAYAMLTNRKHKLELVPGFVVNDFLRVVTVKLSDTELVLLREKIGELLKYLNARMITFTSVSELLDTGVEREMLSGLSDELEMLTQCIKSNQEDLKLTRQALTV